MPIQTNAYLYEINTALLLNRLSRERKQETGLNKIPLRIWKDLRDKGFQYVWMMGMWQRSAASRHIALNDPGLQKEYAGVLPDWSAPDVLGSPYAIGEYKPDSRFGTWADLLQLKARVNNAGLKLILDFVPNHTGLDFPWVKTHPRRYVCSSARSTGLDQDFYKISPGLSIAHGRDPHFPGWTDTLQLNYQSEELRSAMIKVLTDIKPYCDGLRCDMAMLVMNRVFAQTWSDFLQGQPMPKEEFWTTAMVRLKKQDPEFIFIAESYGDTSAELQGMGFDYTYDKTLYDRLIQSGADQIRDHLRADNSYQEKSLRFLENHDERRALAVLHRDRAQAAAVITLTVPGLKMVFDGQCEGKVLRVPVQLGREPQEKENLKCKDFYNLLFQFINNPVPLNGSWQLLTVKEAWKDNESYHNILGWMWCGPDCRRIIFVNFYSAESQARVMLPSLKDEHDSILLKDCLNPACYVRNVKALQTEGLYVALKPWAAHLFTVEYLKAHAYSS